MTSPIPSPRVNWFGDDYLPEPVSISFGYRVSTEAPFMSTAIVAQYNDEGFAIGADSLRTNSMTGEPVSTEIQKIFPIKEKHNKRVLAYGLAGAVEIPNPTSGIEVFNFADQFLDALDKLADTRFPWLNDYITQLAGLVNERLLAEKQNGNLSEYPSVREDPGLIERTIFVGYYNDVAYVSELEFRHDNQNLLPPRLVKMETGPRDFKCFSGSKFINKMIFESKNLKFSKYRTPSVRKGRPPKTLSEAKQLVLNYLQACLDNQKRDKECAKIGGNPHVAIILPDGRFEWFKEPLRFHVRASK